MTVAVHFSVEAELEPHDIVCVTGDCKELGNWDPDKALALECQSSDGNRNVWSRVIALPKDVVCSYRYFICRFLDRGDDIKKSEMVIVRWETNLNPRKLSSSGDADERKFPEVFGHHDGRLSEDSPCMQNHLPYTQSA